MSKETIKARILNEITSALSKDSITPAIVGGILDEILNEVPKVLIVNILDDGANYSMQIIKNDFTGVITLTTPYHNADAGGFSLSNSLPEFKNSKTALTQTVSGQNIGVAFYVDSEQMLFLEHVLLKRQLDGVPNYNYVFKTFQLKIEVYN